MDLLTLILIAIGLSLDTFAASVSIGISVPGIRFYKACRIALVLAFFQGMMPLLGWLLGKQIETVMSNYDHWIAFGLLTALGLKMIIGSFGEEKKGKTFDPSDFLVLTGIAVATSIDALVAGVSFAFFSINIYLSVFVIAAATFLFSMNGMLFGKKAGARFGKKMEIAGGIILIGMGIKILLEHLG